MMPFLDIGIKQFFLQLSKPKSCACYPKLASPHSSTHVSVITATTRLSPQVWFLQKPLYKPPCLLASSLSSNPPEHDFYNMVKGKVGFPGGPSGKEPACYCRRYNRRGFDTWVGQDPLEESLATHSSLLAWRIPWKGEPGGLKFTELQRVRYDWSHWACMLSHIKGKIGFGVIQTTTLSPAQLHRQLQNTA